MASLGVDLEELFQRAKQVIGNSYAPYSGVHVAAVVLADDGTVYLGVNVENVSYGLTICAERAAVAAMITAGRRRIKAVAIVSDTTLPLPPCGACRQVIAEFADDDTVIASRSLVTGETRVWRLRDLLPDPVKPEAIRLSRRSQAPSQHSP
ncbi:cytidine deaminase [Hyperthermus butylicus]|uniref:cytidine deaminase n=1 Tax=Hyperthermus butylicus (strain DSM 5456 / JCM 9403 / PLM1-5) TaxID=415426 RepID=A2BL19_HYPBU|nr:cytidine deaminase [Hyperthermus butylicus]ABM80680.1 Cytidine deaminase [Hyperthermus butylicus DSM 5456]